MGCKEELAGRLVEAATRCAGQPDTLQAAVTELLKPYDVRPAGQNQQGNVARFVKRFIAAKRIEGLSSRTLANYQLYLAKFAGMVAKNVATVSADDVRDYVGSLQVTEGSLQTIMAILRSFFGWLTREELIQKNPMNKIPAPKTGRKRLRRALTMEELERLRNACETIREKALVEFLYSTGCRVSELCSIALQDVDFGSRSVRVTGKGGTERVVYFSIKASLLLQEYIHVRPGGLALFCNKRGCGAMSTRSVEKLIKAIGERAALKESTFPHKLRHTMATLALNNGMAITSLQALLGHRQLSTTQIYASVSTATVRYEHERFVS